MGLWRLKPDWMWRLTGYHPNMVPGQQWEREYAAGAWSRLEGLGDLSHYSVIVGYLDFLKPATILDVGCGHGVLTARIKKLPYADYLGVDISHAAIALATAAHGDDRTRFVVADAETWDVPPGFTACIFNETLYYLRDPRAALRRYGEGLAKDGRIVVSMFGDGRSKVLWPILDKVAETLDQVTLRHCGGSEWTIKLMAPKSA